MKKSVDITLAKWSKLKYLVKGQIYISHGKDNVMIRTLLYFSDIHAKNTSFESNHERNSHTWIEG